MRSYLIDEISPSDMKRIRDFLERSARRSGLEKVFWVEMPEAFLSDAQRRDCGSRPLVFAVELGDGWVKLEFFVRNLHDLRSPSNGTCTHEQQEYVIRYARGMIDALGIRT